MVPRSRNTTRSQQPRSLFNHAGSKTAKVWRHSFGIPLTLTLRYLMLLEDIARNTEKSHPDYDNLVTAHMYIKRAADAVNASEYSMSKLVCVILF